MKYISEYFPKSCFTINYKTYSNFREVKIQNVCPGFKETNYTLSVEGTWGWCCRLGHCQCVKGM